MENKFGGGVCCRKLQSTSAALRGGFLMFSHGCRHGVHAVQDMARGLGIADFKAVGLIQGHDQLEGIHGIQADAARAEQRLVITDLFRADLKHEVFDHEPLDVLFERCIFHDD